MAREYRTITQIAGPLLFVEKTEYVGYSELVEVLLPNGERRRGQVLDSSKDVVVVQVFEGTVGVDRASSVKFLGSRDQSTVWRAPSPKMIMAGSTERKEDHPTQKPLVLFETPIRNHLRPGGQVYDPFLGSGTALIAAERSGCACYALEIDPIYVEVALRRWERFSGEEAVRIDA